MKKDFDSTYKNLGSTLKNLRMQKGITQVELGKLTNKPQSTIARLESINGYEANLRTLYEILEPLNMTLSDLFKEVEGKSISNLSNVSPSQLKKWESIVNSIQSMDDQTRLWTLKFIEFIINRP